VIHKIFIASSSKSRGWATDLQELLDTEMPGNYQFVVWHQDVFRPSSFIFSDLENAASTCSAAIFIFAPDDNIIINDETKKITRDNVIFELGLFVGHLGIDRTIVLSSSDTSSYRLLSDIDGLGTVRFSFKPHDDGNRIAALGPAANRIKRHLWQVLEHDSRINASVLKSVGLVGATDTTEHSALSYVTAIESSRTQFMLLGVGADKITSNRQQFLEMVMRIMSNGGLIRLLLLDPDSHAMTMMDDFAATQAGQFRENVKNSLLRIAEIVELCKCRNTIQMRSYFVSNHDHMPPFRLTFVNHDQCIVSPRSLVDKDRAKQQPQLLFTNPATQDGPAYYGAFLRYFESLWRHSNPESVESMIKKIDKFPKRTALVGCVHGRFQPPHKGHRNYILMAKEKCDVLFIGVTQPNIEHLSACSFDPHRAEAANNPLTFDERAEAIRCMLSADKLVEGKDYVIIPFDIDRPEMFLKYVPNAWIQYTTLIDNWNAVKKARLEELGYDVQVLTDRREDERISGTTIRRLAKSGDDLSYQFMVTPEVFTYLQTICFGERLRSI
jgi:cytidyltransferase-like protein